MGSKHRKNKEISLIISAMKKLNEAYQALPKRLQPYVEECLLEPDSALLSKLTGLSSAQIGSQITYNGEELIEIVKGRSPRRYRLVGEVIPYNEVNILVDFEVTTKPEILRSVKEHAEEIASKMEILIKGSKSK